MEAVRFNVFTKTKKTAKGKEFKVRLTKNKNGVTFEVRFVEGCENEHLIPKDNEPFVLVADNNRLSMTKKIVKSADGEKSFIKHIIYVRAVKDIEKYVEPDFDIRAFNNVEVEHLNDEEIPF